MAEAELEEVVAAAGGHLRDPLEGHLTWGAGENNKSIDDGSSELLRKACRPPTGTYKKSSRRAVIHCSPSNSCTSPDRTKNDSEIVLWKCVLGPPAFGAMSSLYRPNSPWVSGATGDEVGAVSGRVLDLSLGIRRAEDGVDLASVADVARVGIGHGTSMARGDP